MLTQGVDLFADAVTATGAYVKRNLLTATLVVASALFLVLRWAFVFDPPALPTPLVWLLSIMAAGLLLAGYRGLYLVSRANGSNYGFPAVLVWSGFWIVMLLLPVSQW